MLRCLLALSLAVVAAVAALSAPSPTDPKDGWVLWSPRGEIAPRFSREGGALKIVSLTRADYGVWRKEIEGIVPGKTYRMTGVFRTTNVPDPALCASARVEFRRAGGPSARPPDYIPMLSGIDGRAKIDSLIQAPEGASIARVELAFGWTEHGTAVWEAVKLEEATARSPRAVRVATVFHRPRRGTPASNLEAFSKLAEGVTDKKPDVVLLPEGTTVCGTDKSYLEVSEPIPGPSTERLGQLARKLNAYVVAGLIERSGPVLYNVAVLIGRDGKLVGSYRKTHLPREEIEGGLTPGDTYPVFNTDFGKVGLAICWDTQFPEPIRAMALQGAELVLVPIWGGSEIICRARAMENHVYLATSSYDMATFIVDPEGKVLAQAGATEPVVVAEMDLSRKIVQPWLGDMKVRTWRERRPDIAMPRAYGGS
jgi:predicted amidohydrolase